MMAAVRDTLFAAYGDKCHGRRRAPACPDPLGSFFPRVARVTTGRGALGIDRGRADDDDAANRRHQRIASNLEALLNAALKRHDPALAAYHDIGVNIVSAVPYDPEPDVAVIREDENPDPRYAERFYLVAEVLSESDKDVIESKRDIYRAHPYCTCILLVRQDRPEIIADRRTGDGWRSQLLNGADEFALPEFGLVCSVREVYRDTPLG